MTPEAVRKDPAPLETLVAMLDDLHRHGPSDQVKLETLSLYKEFHEHAFREVEQEVIAAMGLFYKIGRPSSLYSYLVAMMGSANRVASGDILTPVQASLVASIRENQFVSISAPTSAGKSYSIRDFISQGRGDAVIVVPSRALIAEYVSALRSFFESDKGVMIMPFVDSVFKARQLRRILVLTPERAREIFDKSLDLKIDVFFFDEAQVSEEGVRGVIFDQLVRRVRKSVPAAKIIFAHPFVSNPDAQFKKHDFPLRSSFSKSYEQGAVGKIFVQHHDNGGDYYFSPFVELGHTLKKCVEFNGKFPQFAFSNKKSVLVYVTKGSIYKGNFSKDFDEYISSLENIEDTEAVSIIEEVRKLVGADQVIHKSTMIELLYKGVVIHHGSVPLEVRFLVERFIRLGFSRICFATNTLAQGINMPFDIVWLNSMKIHAETAERRSLAFKNLIGRAGRLSGSEGFDYGYVYTENPKLLSERLADEYELSSESLIDSMTEGGSPEEMELVKAIREEDFNEELHIPNSRVDRLSSDTTIAAMESVLSLIYADGMESRDSLRGPDKRAARAQVEASLRLVYEAYLGRPLVPGEYAVFKEAVFIMIQSFAGRTFREIVGMRFSSISRRDERDELYADFSQPACMLPDLKLESCFSLYPKRTPRESVSYDVVMFDTYDYLDKVVSFCLYDVFLAASKTYYAIGGDPRAQKFIELLRFGTNQPINVLLMRYGFLPDEIDGLIPHVLRISEQEVVFKASISSVGSRLQKAVEWYL